MERQITRGTKIVLQPEDDSVDLNEPLFAINWFNTRAMWLYNLYNLIAASSVFKIGARVFFKGRIVRTLSGPESAARQVLLIVNYPSGTSFLDLVASRYFQITSVLRMAAVRDFSFTFNRREDGPKLLEHRTQKFDRSHAWIVHHYQSSNNFHDEVQQLRDLTAQAGIRLHFASDKAVTVHTADRSGTQTPLDSVTQRVVILEADNAAQLQAAIEGSYSSFLETVETTHIGEVARTM